LKVVRGGKGFGGGVLGGEKGGRGGGGWVEVGGQVPEEGEWLSYHGTCKWCIQASQNRKITQYILKKYTNIPVDSQLSGDQVHIYLLGATAQSYS